MGQSDAPNLSTIRGALEIPAAKIGWHSQFRRWIFGAPSLSVSASITCHAAIIAIFLSDPPVNKDIRNPISVELVLSDMAPFDLTKAPQENEGPEEDAKAARNLRSTHLEAKVTPMLPIEVDQKLDQSMASANVSSEAVARPNTNSNRLNAEHIEILDEIRTSPAPKNSKPVSTLKPKPAESTRKASTGNNYFTTIKTRKSYGRAVNKNLQKVAETSSPAVIDHVRDRDKDSPITSLRRPKWMPTKKPDVPKITPKAVKFVDASSSLKTSKIGGSNVRKIPLKGARLSPPLLTISVGLRDEHIPSPLIHRPRKVPRETAQQAGMETNADATINTNAPVKITKAVEIASSKEQPKKLTKDMEASNSNKEVAAIAPPTHSDYDVRESATNPVISNEGYSSASPMVGNPKPLYPARAVRKRWQGRVILDVEILPSGTVGVLKTDASSGHWVLDQAAIKAVRQWRFNPAKLAGVAVPSHVQVPVQFKLQ